MTEFAAEMKAGFGVVLASAAGFGLGLSGLPFYTTGVFIEPVSDAFHWSLSQAQGGLTLMMLANTVTLPAAARLCERFGARPVAIVSVLLFGLGYMSMAFEDGRLIVWYLHFVALSIGGAGTLTVVWTQAISGRFAAARGAALGFAMAGTGVTAIFAPVLADRLIDGAGWRGAYLALGALPLLIALPLVLILFREAPDAWAPSGPGRRPRRDAPIVGDWRFWVIGAAFLCIGAAVSGAIPNLVKLLRSHGLSPAGAARIAGLVGVFVVAGRAGCGPILDRVRAPLVAAILFAAAAAACLLLTPERIGPGAVITAAALIGLAAGAEFDILPYLAGRYFGVERVGWALGLLSVFFYLGATIGPVGFGWLHDVSGGYEAPLRVAAAGFGLGGGALLLLDPYPSLAGPPGAAPSGGA